MVTTASPLESSSFCRDWNADWPASTNEFLPTFRGEVTAGAQWPLWVSGAVHGGPPGSWLTLQRLWQSGLFVAGVSGKCYYLLFPFPFPFHPLNLVAYDK